MTGLDHSRIVGVAATMALPPEFLLATPVTARSVFSPGVSRLRSERGRHELRVREGFRYERVNIT
jgi:hypothetical protein